MHATGIWSFLNWARIALLGLIICRGMWVDGLAQVEAGFQAGTAAVDITPPIGTPLAGYYHARGAEGVLDPLFSRALVIARGEDVLVLVTLDLIGVTRDITDAARQIIRRDCGISDDRVLISATHAHTGPVLRHPGRRAESLGGQDDRVAAYHRELPSRIAESVKIAHSQLEPARLRRGLGLCEGLAFNRRYYMRDGTVGWNPGKLNPNIVRPAGPTDPEVGVLFVENAPQRDAPSSLATYVNFAMHPDTCGGNRISADWPGALARLLARYHGPQHLTLLGNGASGNINHLDFHSNWPNHGPAEQERIATILGAAVLQTYKQLQAVEPSQLAARSERVELDPRDVTPDEVAWAERTLEATQDDRGGNFMNLVRAYRILDVAERRGTPFQVEVQVVAIGREVAWVGLPGEIFVELGLAIKQRSPFPVTFVVSLANENLGYIPDRRSYAEGNYEPESARCAPGSGEKLVEAAVRQLTELHGEFSVRRESGN